jgi:ParB/RepB/Spo0J family partition protein
MNAPAQKTALAPESAYKFIEIDQIIPSNTHIQQLRRARSDPAAMAELVASVAAHGVLQAILVRENPEIYEGKDAASWQIVAGERRWIAARTAKLAQIPAIVRDLTDLQVLEIQLVENLQREGLHPLEEAEGFADLMKLKSVSAEAIAETIGRSRSYVSGRLKLLDLIPAAREAFNTGKIDASKAQLIARIALPKLQAKALKHALSTNYQNEPISLRDFKHWLDNNKFTVELKHVSFRLNDAKLFPAAGSCIDCPKRTGNLGDLFTDIKDPNVCTDPDCFGKKMAAQVKRLRTEAEASGRAILSGEAAKAIDAGHGSLRGYIDLDDESDEAFAEPEPVLDEHGTLTPEYKEWAARADDFQPRTYRQILGEAGTAAAVLLDAGNKLREIVPVAVARKLLKPHGIALPSWIDRKPEPAVDPAERRDQEEKQRERQEREEEFRRALLAQIHAKFKGPLKREDMAEIATFIVGATDTIALEAVCYGGKRIQPEKMTEIELTRLLAELSVTQTIEYVGGSPAPLLALAKRCKIDPAKVKKDLATAAKKPTPKKATKK